jgi:transcriptional regulator with XRE-family HTH domain
VEPDVKTDNKIGHHIRKLRRQQHRTLQQIADACGFSKSLLSKIETGRVFPPIATLVKIAGAMGTKVTALLEEAENLRTVVNRSDEVSRNTVLTEKGYAVFPFASEFRSKKMQPFLFTAKRGEVQHHDVAHEGEEFIYIVEGTLKFHVGDVEYTLRRGDGLYFEALDVHGFEPISDAVTYIDIFV